MRKPGQPRLQTRAHHCVYHPYGVSAHSTYHWSLITSKCMMC